MSGTQERPEVWLRGPVDGFDPWLLPVAHALLQVREDIERLRDEVKPEQVWLRPGDAASIGFHIRHLGGALDRLFTYARGAMLDNNQLRALRAEAVPGDPPEPLASLVAEVNRMIELAFDQLRATPRDRLLDERRVGRAGLPSNVIGLLFHAAEHSTRHAGQAITTARIVRAQQP